MVWEEQGGFYYINAPNEDEADKIADENLYNSVPFDKVTHGDRYIMDTEVYD